MNSRCPTRGQRSEVRGQGPGFRVQGSGEAIANCKLQTKVDSGQWAVDSAKPQAVLFRRPPSVVLSPLSTCHSPLIHHSSFRIHHSAFTLVELLVTITIIAIIAGIALGALRYARVAAVEAKTKATIAKLNHIIMQQYESYMTRRLPIDTQGFPPNIAAEYRLVAIRDLMRMEMPERFNDISDLPLPLPVDPSVDPVNYWPWPTGTNIVLIVDHWQVTLPGGQILNIPLCIPEPALHLLYREKYQPPSAPTPIPTGDFSHAECLYAIVSMAHPEAMEQFTQDEIGDLDHDGWPEFIDGWGRPIYFLRSAPGFSYTYLSTQNYKGLSEIQSGDFTIDHDPFDSRNIDSDAFRLVPLIISAGQDGYINNITTDPNAKLDIFNLDINMGKNIHFNGYPCDGAHIDIGGVTGPAAYDDIHNHHIE